MGKSKMCVGHWVAAALVFVGALNWGLVGAFNFNLVDAVLGSVPTAERVVYALVGLSALFMLLLFHCKGCGKGGSCCKDDAAPSAGGHSGGCAC